MNTNTPMLRVAAAVAFLGVVAIGCDSSAPADDRGSSQKPSSKPVETHKVEIGKNVTLEVQGDKRRVLINATVCLNMGALELFMCRKQSKEHESILTSDSDARKIHEALIVANAEPGKPARYLEKGIQPPTGTRIKISVQYEKKGKLVTERAGKWVRNMKTLKQLDEDWVFAGSAFTKNVLDPKKPDIYLANEGDVICVSNFEDAMLDLPIASSKDDADRSFEAFTERIPPLETKVLVILEPVLDGKKPKK
jgi:hypothetical protein